MAERRPLTIIGGQVQELPSGDTVAGAPGSSAWKEPVTVYNSGSPEVVFISTGDVVMTNAS